jgi:tetratricopeptide (TPR) repeat protein
MTLAVGTRLGPYEIIGLIGIGGMGEVYRARDSNLNREVALKILPELLTPDPDRVARFKREAQVLASLNHPNIGGIYGFEESGGHPALVLELVEGSTLADRIQQGPIPVGEALSSARQVAEALETAHHRGVIHRDLKPANIKLRPDGTAKVLDFGLAKAWDPASIPPPNFSQSPTMATPVMTQAGMILGTPTYMSPEQARGKPVDARADIWAFGCVLYEMLTGRSAFAGETISDTIARILERAPEWQDLPASTPTRVRGLLGRCLQKEQERRLQDITIARVEIQDIQTGPTGSRRVGLPAVAAVIGLAVAVSVGGWWFAWRPVSQVAHAPLLVIIADFQNTTGDAVFDRTLEPLLRIVLEGASFISAYDRTQVNRAFGIRPPETFDEPAAREIAVKQGIGVVLSGSVDHQTGGYTVSVQAVQTVTGQVVRRAQGTAPDKERVLSEAARLVTSIREALGDDTSDSARRFAGETLSTTSLPAVHEYAAAIEAIANSQFDAARQSFSKAVSLDPNFGLAYAGMAIMSSNQGRQQDAETYAKEAVRHVDHMTERERYRTRGLFYLINSDHQACVKEYGDLLSRYAADVAARNNLALCLGALRNMPRAVEELQKVVAILPKRALYRINLALYLAYEGDFRTAEREAHVAQELGSALGLLPLAFAQLGQGRSSQAAESYRALGKTGVEGASFAASGLGDLAVYEGRFSDAARIFEQGAADDLSSSNADRAAAKYAALANAELLRQRKEAAIAAAEKALVNGKAADIRFLVARFFVEAGEIARARSLAAGLASEFQVEPRTYARIVEGEAALKNGNPRQALERFAEANGLLDTWMGHFDLGRAFVDAGEFTQADSEFDRCITRRGESLSMFMNEEPTFGYFPRVYYYQGRAREGLNSKGFADSYRAYLRIRQKAGEDPILAEVRRRAGL